MDNQRLLFTIPEVAEAFGISRSTAYRLIESGEIATVKVRSKLRIRSKAIEQYLDSQERLSKAQSVGF